MGKLYLVVNAKYVGTKHTTGKPNERTRRAQTTKLQQKEKQQKKKNSATTNI